MDLIEILKVIVLGIIQGITEWLPISSTGHMILVDEFIQLNVSGAFKDLFLVVIQLGSIMAVVVIYFNKLNPFSPKKNIIEKRETWNLWFKVAIATIPATIIGLLFDDIINETFYNYLTVAIMLIIYGILFIVIENRNKNTVSSVNKLSQITYRTAFIIGLFQVLALIPGTSRSGATIIGAILVGTSRYIAAEFTFFMAIPVMFGASFLKLIKFGLNFTLVELTALIIGMVVAFIVSVWAIKFLLDYIKRNDFKIFGHYRIILGIIVILYFNILN